MLRTATVLLFSTAMFCAPAMAQTTQGQSSAPATPQASAPATASPASGSKFVTDQKMEEFRASKFMGLDIYGSDNEKIGDIKEILFDAQGGAKSIVIGVGGFLGIGEKNVAIPWSAVTWVNERPQSRSAANTGGTTGAGTSGAGSTTTGAGTTSAGAPAGGAATTSTTGTATTGGPATAGTPATRGPATTGTATTGGGMTGGTATNQRSAGEQAAMNGAPDHGKVQLTKAELNDAPTFRWYGENRGADNQPRGGSTPQRQ